MSGADRPIKIMLVDDHQMIIDSLKLLFDLFDDFEVVRTEHDSRKVIEHLEGIDVDVLITDLKMPYLDGIQLANMVSKSHPDIRILMLTVNEDPADIRAAYNAGASGYVLKKANRKTLEEAVRQVASGKMYFGQDALKAIFSNQREHEEKGQEKSLPSELTKREVEIVKLLTEELSSTEIAEKLHISPGTVETHRHNILRKLNVKTTIGVIKFAFRTGLVTQ